MISLLFEDCMESMGRMADNSIHLIVTDPPYGIEYKSGRQSIDRKRSNRREGDVAVRESYFSHIVNDTSLPTDWIQEAYRVLCDGSAMYVFCHWKKWGELQSAVAGAGFEIKNMIVLNKSNHGMGDLKGSFSPRHELLMLAVKGRHILRFPNGRKADVWDVPVKFSGAIRLHPNEKPVTWVTPAIENSTDAGQTVYDPFMGSAGTAIASIETHRGFVGSEIDSEHFCTAQIRVINALHKNNCLAEVARMMGKPIPEIAKELGERVPDVARRLK